MTILLADIGGTHARFGLCDDGGWRAAQTLIAADYPTLADAARSYLSAQGANVRHARFSVAAPIFSHQDNVDLVNHPAWNFSKERLKRDLALDTLSLVNDFEALALAVPFLDDTTRRHIGGGAPIVGGPIAILGPGTGLGMATIVFIDGKPHVIASEGGNATIAAPDDARGFALIEKIRDNEKRQHICIEDVISGPGLLRLYRAIAALESTPATYDDPSDIAAAAVAKSCPMAMEAFDRFCHGLGGAAGNLALTVQPSGGIYIAGGIIPKWIDAFLLSPFRQGLIDKGPYEDFLAGIPVYLVTHPYPAFEGLRHVKAA